MKEYLKKQRALQLKAYHRDPSTLEGEEFVEFVRWNILAATDELHEMLHEVDGWKPWQTDRRNAGRLKNKVEFIEGGVDVLHFIANLLVLASVEDDALDHLFDKKQARNLARQQQGYAGVGKEDGIR